MAFDKYVLRILSFYLTQPLWGLWLCQFCSKVSFVSAFQDHFDPICMPSACPEVFYSFYWNCIASRWMWPRQRHSWASLTPECLLDCSPFYDSWACPASFCDAVLDKPSGQAWLRSFCKGAPHQWGCKKGGDKILGAGATQCDIQCISDLTGQFSLPWMSLFGKSLRSKRSAIRRALACGCLVSHAVESLTEALDKEDQLWAANT